MNHRKSRHRWEALHMFSNMENFRLALRLNMAALGRWWNMFWVLSWAINPVMGDQSIFHRDLDPPWHGIPMTWDDALATMHPLTTHRTQWSNDMVKIFQCQLGVRSTTSPFVSWISTGHHSCRNFIQELHVWSILRIYFLLFYNIYPLVI